MRQHFNMLGLNAALALAVALTGCSGDAGDGAATEAPKIPVQVAVAETRRVQRTVRVLGTLHGDEEATLSSKVTGVLKVVRADVGDVVSGSAVLAELEPEDFAQAVSVARWSLQQSLARLGTDRVPQDTFDVDQVAPVARARAQLANSRVKLGRLQELAREGAGYVAEQDVRDAETNAAVAVANVDVERLAARALVAEARQRQAELETRRSRLADTRIAAPAGGRSWAVAERLVSQGEYVREGTALFRVVAQDILELRAAVPERYVPVVKVGQTVTVTVEAYGETVFQGTVTRINPTVDPASRTFGVQIRVRNGSGALRPGTFARAEILTAIEDAVVVPLESVVSVAGISKVFLLTGGVVKEVLVQVGERHGAFVEVTAVKAGDRVVTSGQTVVTDGAAVALVQAGAEEAR